MSSIRPLITISILIAAGVFLYTKINENPAHLVPDANEAAQDASGVPPLTPPIASSAPNGPASLTPGPAWNGTANSTGESAPKWSNADAEKTCPVPAPLAGAPASGSSMSAPGSTAAAPAAITPDSLSLPEVPKIPDMPLLPAAPEASNTPSAPSNPPTVTPLTLNPPVSTAASPATATPAAKDDDRYGSISSAPNSTPALPAATAAAPAPQPTAPAPKTFASEWPVIQAALAQQELGKAHQMLTQWYGDSTLSPQESEQVQSLLNQLAGTVVYSNQSCLVPPYVVRSGDTLESIAKQYDVPWQLLAKINGIPASDLVQPGQQLKVIHGPFSAAVDLSKGQMVLTVDGRYAGRFSVTPEANAATSEGQWTVAQKVATPSTSAAGASGSVYAVGPAAVDHVLLLKKDSPAGSEISITSGPTSPAAPTAAAPPAFRLAPRDADEVADILSVGSRVTIKK
jgi:LysM repeat protein